MKTIQNRVPMIVMGMMTFAVIASISAPAHAEEASRWNVKSSIVLVDANDPFSYTKPGGGEVHAGGNAELGISFAAEYRVTDLIGLEFGALYAKSPDVNDKTNANNDEIGEGPSFFPLMGGVNLHLMDTKKLDLYVGPRIAFVNFGNFDLDIDGQSTDFEVDSEFAWGATAGLNYQFGNSRWAFVAEATYLDVDMKVTERGTDNVSTVGFDPLMVNLGASYRF